MDSTALLDSALFQLTPTRTRFDLVLFCGSKNEKLASGLFEPFISHLKFARDQISKGGYSITLHPPTSRSSWFTKFTFDRFVRFVNTPAILERFVSLEKEIAQIEHSIQANEVANATASEQPQEGSKTSGNNNLRKSNEFSKLQKEFEKSNDCAEEENSKIQLQRLLETRRTLLRREQAMAYARGVAAGFEMDGMDDLISFANAFGASRLSEACNNYKELWNKKHGDGLWMAELAAVKACAPPEMSLFGSSGIVLANEVATLSLNGNDSAPSIAGSDPKDEKSGNSEQIPSGVPAFQASMAWPNHIPPYFYPFQQPPPYQGYPYPPMQPHQNAGNMAWPQKGKSHKKKGNGDFGGGDSSDSSEYSESDSSSDDSASSLEDQGKRRSRAAKDYRKSTKNRKKSSKTVIIRNINYITPEGRNEDMEGNESTDNISVKESVDAAVGLFGKEKRAARQGSGDDIIKGTPEEIRSNENWDSFQNILMNYDEKSVDAANSHSMDVGEDHFTLRSSVLGANSDGLHMKEKVPVDFSMVTRGSVENGGAGFEHFESEKSARRLPKTMDSADECMLLPKRSEMLGNGSRGISYATGAENSVIRSGKGEDWFVADQTGKLQNYERTSFDDNCILTSEGSCNARVGQSKKQEFIDDSFMVQSSLTGDDLYDSRWRPDISVAADLALANMENGHANMQQEKREIVEPCEPNDLFMILERNPEAVDDSLAIDHGFDLSLAEANARLSSIGSSQDMDKSISSGEKENNVKNADARAKSRIPGRSLLKNRTETMSKTAKKPSVASRTMAQKSKLEKEEEMRKRIEDLLGERQRRIAERTAMSSSRRRASLESATGKSSATRDANRAPCVRARAT